MTYNEWNDASDAKRFDAYFALAAERDRLAKENASLSELSALHARDRDAWERRAGQYMDERDRLAERAERLEQALWYALNQHEHPLRFSAQHGHWSAMARATLAGATDNESGRHPCPVCGNPCRDDYGELCWNCVGGNAESESA